MADAAARQLQYEYKAVSAYYFDNCIHKYRVRQPNLKTWRRI